MPIKVRCRGCEKSLNIPDSLRGKTVKCPECGEKMKIPGGDQEPVEASAKPAPKPAPKPAAKKSSKPKDDPSTLSGEIFANLNLDNTEHEDEQICPYCAAPLEEDDPVCRKCGMDSETGKMDPKEKKKRSRKGPDTAKYWGLAWKDPWAFILEHKSLPFRTGWYWTQFAYLVAGCFFMAHDFCDRGPPKTFWYGMTALTLLGIPGWYWYLSIRLVQAETFREEVKPDRIHFDFFQNVSIGLRAIIWPFVVMLPLMMVLGAIYLLQQQDLASIMDEQTLMTVAGASLAIPFIAFPIATAHMSAKYTYRAWIGWELLVAFGKAAGACMYWLLQAILMFGPIAGILAALHYAGGGVNPFSNTHIDHWVTNIATWFMGIIGEQTNVGGEGGEPFTMLLIRIVLKLTFAILTIAPISFLAGFPAVYMMRSNALLAYYFQNKIEPVNETFEGVPVGFWVRFLAFWGDMMLVPLSSFLVLKEKRAVIVGQLINACGLLIFIFQGNNLILKQAIGVIFTFYNWWMYFAVQESSGVKSTVGKEGFGALVNTEKGRQMSLKQATVRWFCAVLSALTCGAGFVMCAFHPKKRALHDLMSKTCVEWRGDK